MAHRREFYLYKRHKKNGDYWYVCFLDRETGRQMNAKSIDCLKEKLGIMDFTSVKRKEDAAVIAHKALEAGLVFSKGSECLFSSWCLDFWDWEKSEYIALRNRLCPGSIGREYAYNMQKNFQKHVVPLLPRSLKLQNVTVAILDRVVKALYRSDNAPGTVKIIVYSFSIPLKEAARLGLIVSNPADMLLLGGGDERERGCLTQEEMLKLMERLDDMGDRMSRTLVLAIKLAASTGMRLSEVRAVSVSDFLPSSVDGFERLSVSHSLAYMSGVKCTKGKYGRTILLPSSFAEELKGNADSEGHVFPSPREKGGYLSPPTIRTAFYLVLEMIGISGEEREERNITFHSLRHTFNTISRDMNISQEERMLALGHRSRGVNDRYGHASDEAIMRISRITCSILSYGAEECSEKCGNGEEEL